VTSDVATRILRDGPKWAAGTTIDPLLHKKGAIGSQHPRIDGPEKVSGLARFAAEIDLPGMTYAALAYSTIAKGRIKKLNVSRAEAADGVVLVMTHRNAPRTKAPPIFMSAPLAVGASTLPVMQDDAVHWNGQPIAVVLAESQQQADHAAALIEVAYETVEPRLSFERAKGDLRTPKAVIGEPPEVVVDHPVAALAAAPVKVDVTYRTQRLAHQAIELHAATVAWEDDDRLMVHDASQMVNMTAWTLAQVFGIAEDKVRVSSPYVGGGFGGKSLWDHQILAACAAKLARRPVRIVLTRAGVARIIGGRTTTEQQVTFGAKRDGSLDALVHQGVAANSPNNEWPEQFSLVSRLLYQASSYSISQKIADLDMRANTYMRGPGEAVGTLALECALDELSIELGMDPIDLRRRIEPKKHPISGKEFSMRNLLQCYDRGAERFGWKGRNEKPGSRRDGEWLIGHGCATATYPYVRAPGGKVRVEIKRDGRALVQTAMHEMGMGTATAHRQLAADRLGLAYEDIDFEYGDTDLPPGVMAGGSAQTVSMAGMLISTHEALVRELLQLAGNASPLSGLSFEDVESFGAGLRSRDDHGRTESYVSILERAGRTSIVALADGPDGDEFVQYAMHSYGAHFCEVAVSSVTGETRIRRMVSCFDVGRIINPKTAASQLRGGVIMGIGMALMEEQSFDERTGRIMTPSMADYHIPSHLDVPELEVMWLDEPDPFAPAGAHGVGEIGVTGSAAAIGNAVFDATGVRVRDFPITLDRLIDKLPA
jgi:xanthine dehydrogenase YagR molybdenum-binding subunit